ncbi:MAG: DUF192 domain-containing protein [Ectothiorhodospiraceae bacterium]|jgi:uncharacterized membrane protein (UPF0127 family)
MRILRYAFLAVFLAGGLLLWGQLFSAETPQQRALRIWNGMEVGMLSIESPDGGHREIEVRIADTSAERAQGMQYIPPPQIRRFPIWFVFQETRTVGWHMENVRLPLEIAWVSANGRVVGVGRMEPGGTGYGTAEPIRYALETAAGNAQRLGIEPGARLRLSAGNTQE